MARISRRFAAIRPSATLAIDAKAKALKAAGAPVIGFGAGEPDFPTPAAIVEAAVVAARDPRNHKYSPTGGLPELRQALATKTARDSGYHVTPRQILVTNGGKQAVEEAFAVLLDREDEVLLPTPYWTTYPEAIRLADGVPVEVPTDESTGFKVSVEQLDRARTDRTKILLFVSPSNPTGAVYTDEETTAIGRWCLTHGIWVITDEIYEHLVYDGLRSTSMPVLVPELADTCLVLNGVAKTYAMTGWRVGWLIGPEDVVEAATNYQSHATSNVSNVAQRAALAAVSGSLDDVVRMRESFDRRRRRIVDLLNQVESVSCLTPGGAFYVYPNLSGLLGRPLAGEVATTTLELADLVLDKVEVAFVPGEAFGTPGYGRFSYALGDHDLEEGIGRLIRLAQA